MAYFFFQKIKKVKLKKNVYFRLIPAIECTSIEQFFFQNFNIPQRPTYGDMTIKSLLP